MIPSRIFLVGLSGGGKSTAGRLAAQRLGWDFADSDDEIERISGRRVTDIFRDDGEDAFRALELSALKDLSVREPIVIATGGGAVTTPEARELGNDFAKNKGKLPWPVTKGTITTHFGRHQHPVLDNVWVDCNGIDIGCEKGASVRAIFRGEVSSVIVIPGAGKAVIVSHGAYRTVYSNLRDVSVAKGQKLETKQTVGTVMTDDEGSTAHIEIWKITTEGELVKVDPETWIYQD